MDFENEAQMLLNKIKSITNSSNNFNLKKEMDEALKEILEVIKDGKRRRGYYGLALDIINRLEEELKENFPSELIYRKACIYNEYESNYEKAEYMFNEFLNKCDYSDPELKIYADRTKLYLIKMALKKIDYSGFNKNKENFEKAMEYLKYLNIGVENRDINDEVILSYLGKINNIIEDYCEEEKEYFRAIDLNTRNKYYFSDINKIKEYYDKYDIVIEYSSLKVYIRGITISLSKNKLDFLTKVCFGCEAGELIKDKKDGKINTAHQRFRRLKMKIQLELEKELAKIYNIQLEPKKKTKNEQNQIITLNEIDPSLLHHVEEKEIKFLGKGLGQYGVESSERIALIIERKDMADFCDNITNWEEL